MPSSSLVISSKNDDNTNENDSLRLRRCCSFRITNHTKSISNNRCYESNQLYSCALNHCRNYTVINLRAIMMQIYTDSEGRLPITEHCLALNRLAALPVEAN